MVIQLACAETMKAADAGYKPALVNGRRPSAYVNPFIGAVTHSVLRNADSQGKTIPGACYPYGLVQLSPDSITGGDNGSGYNYEHRTLQGFSFTHMSGVGWYGDLGNFLVMPSTGQLKTSYGLVNIPNSGYLSRKGNETASPGYYAVSLLDYGIRAELTVAAHSGMLRFTYPQSKQSRIQIDLARRIGGTSELQSVKVVGERSIEGWMRCTEKGGGWGNGGGHPNYTVFFHAEFSKPLKNFGIWSMAISKGARRRGALPDEDPAFVKQMASADVIRGCRELEGAHLGFFTEFETGTDEIVLMKSGISYTSLEGARQNVAEEIPGWNFDSVRSAARDRWDREISRIAIQGGTESQRIAFYTALYRAMIDPRAFADRSGAYPGGDGKIHTAANYTRRTIFSGWDVYRSQYPLMTLIAPTVVQDMIHSLTDLAVESNKGYLERWEFLNAYSGCMNGNPAVPIIADAYAKGIRGYDAQQVYAMAKQTCEKIGPGDKGYFPGALSDTTEHNLDEWCLSQMAHALGKEEDARRFAARSQGYRHLFNPKTGWFEGGCVESNPGQQGWFVPHDVPGLIELVGGPEKFVSRLNTFFERTPDVTRWNDFYNHANEPVHQIPFLFNRAGAPWLTQKWVRYVCENAYGCDVYGCCGDDDVGQMSAWFVLCASGLHQACTGDTRYELFTPLFDSVIIRIDPLYGRNKTFTITTCGNGPGPRYIQSATLNGHPLNRCWLDHKEIVAGGTLQLNLGTEPEKTWGISNH